MALATRWYDRNLSKLELVVVIILISIFIGVFAFRVLKIFALTEQTSVTLTINNINTVLKYQAIMALAGNRDDELAALQHINPMQLVYAGTELHTKTGDDLQEEIIQSPDKPVWNYAGEFHDPDIEQDIAPGSWYYDRNGNLLIYRLRNTEFFNSTLEGPARIRYMVKLEYEDINANDQFDPEEDRFINIKIESIDAYGWNI